MSGVSEAKQPWCALGLDIGGTKMVGCILTPQNEVVASETIPTRAERGGKAVADDAIAAVQELSHMAEARKLRPAALGISVCELVNHEGTIVSDATLKWRDPTILQNFTSLYPTTFEADSRAAALAESRLGQGKGHSCFLYVSIGTGISCSLVVDGVPYRGAQGLTGTLATGTLATVCSECGNTSYSCLEELSSGAAVSQRYAAELGGEPSQALSCCSVIQSAEAGEPIARRIVTEAAVCVGSTISLLVSVLDPQVVIVGGGLGTAPGIYWDTLVQTAWKHIWCELQKEVPFLQSRLGPHGAAVGAALLASERIVPRHSVLSKTPTDSLDA